MRENIACVVVKEKYFVRLCLALCLPAAASPPLNTFIIKS